VLIRQRFNIMLFSTMLSCIAFSPASARVWPAPAPNQIASDYAAIQHRKSTGDFVMINWVAAPTIAPSDHQAESAKAMLKKYVVIMVVHCHGDQTNRTLSCNEINTLAVNDRSSKPLTLVARDTLAPADLATLVSMETAISQAFGLMGSFFSTMRTSMKLFVFDAGQVDACEKGELSVPFAGETYTWETPFPGCTKN
jgi:hypothetical protein